MLKLSGKPKIVETMAALGVGRYVRPLGVVLLWIGAFIRDRSIFL